MDLGRILLFGGVFLMIAGMLLVRWPNLLCWFGRLPGDLHYQGGKVSMHIPLASMIVASIILTVGINVVAWLLSWK